MSTTAAETAPHQASNASPTSLRLRLQRAALSPKESASLAAMRILLGLLVSFGAARFIAYGWIERFFGKPQYFFHFWGFDWIEPLSVSGLTALFYALVGLGLCISAGLLYRPAIILTFIIFTYIELLDVTNYLNHYYLVSLLTLLFCFLPANASYALDNKLWRRQARAHIPAYLLWLLRAQVGLVYFNAGLAKLSTDWLIHAQPLNIWLNARTDTPIIGPLLAYWPTALAMSWAGFLFDTTIAAFLLWPKSRHLAYLALITFHLLTGQLFNIGLFPLIMIACAPIFFDPGWPRRLRSKPKPPTPAPFAPSTKHHIAMLIAALWVCIQGLMPLRAHLYGGDPLWHEQGMHWSWRVMVREKNGSVTYRVKLSPDAKPFYVSPSRYLTDYQEREFSGQPDMILQLGQHIGRSFITQGHPDTQLYVDAIVSLNGRPAQPLIDPHVDLMQLRDSLAPKLWILPGPTSPPPKLSPR